MIYFGSGSSLEFSEFRIRIQAKVLDPDPNYNNYVYSEIIQKHTLTSIKKKNLDNYLPFSISYYNPTVQTVQNSQFHTYHLSLFAGSGTIIPDQGKSSGSMRIRIHKTGFLLNISLPDPEPYIERWSGRKNNSDPCGSGSTALHTIKKKKTLSRASKLEGFQKTGAGLKNASTL